MRSWDGKEELRGKVGGDEVIREVEGLLVEGVTQGLVGYWEDFGVYSDQGGSPGGKQDLTKF